MPGHILVDDLFDDTALLNSLQTGSQHHHLINGSAGNNNSNDSEYSAHSLPAFSTGKLLTSSKSIATSVLTTPTSHSNLLSTSYSNQQYDRLQSHLLRPIPRSQLSSDACNQRKYTLYPSARFQGHQLSGLTRNEVQVDIQHVDLSQGFMCGYLSIKDLTECHPSITTYFDAEIVGTHHSFLTRRWGADADVDKDHWMKFPPFHALSNVLQRDNPVSMGSASTDSDYLFMRWKECFLIPDHRVEIEAGASFAGFYYVMMQLSTGNILGYYFHPNCERYQELILSNVPIPQQFASYEFR